MIDLGLEALLIMDKAGIPLLFQNFDPKKMDIEPVLLSGFLTAVKEFSTAILDESIKDFHVDYGKRLVTIISGQRILFAAIHNQTAIQKIVPTLTPLLREFEENYYDEKSLGESGPLQKYDPFRERILSVLGISNPSLEWIPFFTENYETSFQVVCKLNKFIDNNHTIDEIIKQSNCERKDVIREVSRLWAFGQIKFRNMITKKDIVIPTSKIANYLNTSSYEWKMLTQQFSNLKNNLPFIISYFDGKTPVGDILNEFSDSIENLYWLIDYLYIQGAITILSSEKRRILMAKEILEKSLELAVKFFSAKTTVALLKQVLREINTSEIISQIKISEEKWTIDYNLMVYEQLTPEKIIDLYEKWLEILKLFIFSLSEKKRKSYIQSLTEELDYQFFEKYRSEDLDGFEEFAFWLELIFN